MTVQGLKMVRLSSLNTKALIDMTWRVYLDQPIHKNLNINQKMLENSPPNTLLLDSINNHFSYGLVKDDQIASASFALPYLQYISTLQKVKVEQLPQILQASGMLFGQAQSNYQPKVPGKVMVLYMAVTDPKYTRRGCMTALMQKSINQAIKQGYNQMIANCVVNNSTNVLKKLGFQSQNYIAYDDFYFNGKKYFPEVEGEKGLNFMVKRIQHEK